MRHISQFHQSGWRVLVCMRLPQPETYRSGIWLMHGPRNLKIVIYHSLFSESFNQERLPFMCYVENVTILHEGDNDCPSCHAGTTWSYKSVRYRAA
ncbi:hypothetical protein TNIN_157511 [Trichonephila inaurata madagascariensis]|uniref:Uncharacterized protein n=1 Tax=Trichonephila inaurata madagascariensis TaxID=2747483 RepID=A0A8X6YTR8_9ARAC|nr:hypothetical protein TNIN_157511 [Trichonephila inaurata madagascariensis]